MSDIEIRYKTEEVSVIRGSEANTVEKRNADGWELVSQEPTKYFRTKLTFRRPVTIQDRLKIAGLVAFVLVAFLGLGAIALIEELKGNQPSNTSATEVSDSNKESVDDVLTVETSPMLNRILMISDDFDAYEEFWANSANSIIEFDGNIAYVTASQESPSKTGALITGGNYDPEGWIGAAFRVVGLENPEDFHFKNTDQPAVEGMNVRITARLINYNDQTGNFDLEIISTTLR